MGRRREGPGCLVARTAQVVQVASFGWANYGGCLAIASAACTRRFSTNQGAACSGDGMQLVRVATHSRHCARTRKASTARKACCPHDDTADLAPECHTRISWSSSPPAARSWHDRAGNIPPLALQPHRLHAAPLHRAGSSRIYAVPLQVISCHNCEPMGRECLATGHPIRDGGCDGILANPEPSPPTSPVPLLSQMAGVLGESSDRY